MTHLDVCVVCAALEKKMASRQGREDLIKKGLLEMMEQGKWATPGRAGGLTGVQQAHQGGVEVGGVRCPAVAPGPE